MRALALASAVLWSAVLGAAVAGCSSAASGPLVLTWTFADRRDCITAGVTSVEARVHASPATTPLATFDCAAGRTPATVTLPDAPGSGTLFLDARDADDLDLYRGTLSLDDEPPGTGDTRSVTLIADGAE